MNWEVIGAITKTAAKTLPSGIPAFMNALTAQPSTMNDRMKDVFAMTGEPASQD